MVMSLHMEFGENEILMVMQSNGCVRCIMRLIETTTKNAWYQMNEENRINVRIRIRKKREREKK